MCACTASKWRTGSIDSRTQIARGLGARGMSLVIYAWSICALHTRRRSVDGSFGILLELETIVKYIIHKQRTVADKVTFSIILSLMFVHLKFINLISILERSILYVTIRLHL